MAATTEAVSVRPGASGDWRSSICTRFQGGQFGETVLVCLWNSQRISTILGEILKRDRRHVPFQRNLPRDNSAASAGADAFMGAFAAARRLAVSCGGGARLDAPTRRYDRPRTGRHPADPAGSSRRLRAVA